MDASVFMYVPICFVCFVFRVSCVFVNVHVFLCLVFSCAVLWVCSSAEKSYELDTSVYDVSESAEVLEWEWLMQETMANEAEVLDLLNVVYLTSRSIDDALEGSIWGETEIHLLIVTCELLDNTIIPVCAPAPAQLVGLEQSCFSVEAFTR